MSHEDLKFVLVTGGAGYIGSHVILEMIRLGVYQPVVVDSFANASSAVMKKLEKLSNSSIDCHSFNLLEKEKLKELFRAYNFYGVVHLAGLKAVGESVKEPLMYYRINLDITMNLLEVMKEFNVKKFIFSSSATVYGMPAKLPIDENHPVGNCSNPYGKTKYFIEEILQDLCRSDPSWNVIMLRYFNPVGAHHSGEIGEAPNGLPNNLMPVISQVLLQKRPFLSIYGNNYNTPDGTGVRDYIHVVDLALGHLAALKKLEDKSLLRIYNLGTGKGYSVLDLLMAMEKASGKKIPYKIEERREGDIATCYADPQLAWKELGWKADKGIDQFCEDTWRWLSQNPHGYQNNV